MRPRTAAVLAGVLLFALPVAAQKVAVKDLPPRYRDWLQEEAVYIISPKEKAVFLQLSNDREREMFIEAFWKARDTDPSTPQNEAKDEHYRRIKYANENFGRGLSAGGWRSDRGRIYITLGEPKQIEKYENLSNVYPMLVWFYSGLATTSLPSSFNIVFFKPNDAGDYILYSPMKDGPQKLLPFYSGDQTSYIDAYRQLMEIEPLIAQVSLTLIPNEYVMGSTPSVSSDILLGQKIPQSAYDAVRSAYADKLLRYKDVIEVEYTANYIDSDALVQVTRDGAGRAFVHYLLEPGRLSLERVGNLFRTTFEINGIVSDAAGKPVYQFDRTIPIELQGDQFLKIKDRKVSVQDAFPLIDGDYKFSLLWKNTVSKEFSSIEASLTIPPARTLTLSPPVLGNRAVRNPAFAGQVKPFTFGQVQIVASPRNDFVLADTLSLYSELGGVTPALREGGRVRVALVRGGQPVAEKSQELRGAADPFRIAEDFPLAGLPPDYYAAEVTVLDAAGAAVLASKTDFYISLATALPRAWIIYQPLPAAGDPAYPHILGLQHFQAGDEAKARALLEAAYRRSPESAPFALDYCRVLLAAKDYDGVRSVALPFYRDKKNFEFAQSLGESAQALGRYAEAVGYYKDYLTSFGTNLVVLNAIGDCYVKTGDLAGALTAWKKSLELNPAQEDVKKKLADLQDRMKEKK
jgi:GWxTD domain-containing protein